MTGLMLLASCSMVPDYQRPEMAVPPAWKASAAGAEEPPSAEWWKTFQSATLDTLVAAAQRENPDIGIAAARILQADAQVRIAGAPLLPSIDADAADTRAKSAVLRSKNATTRASQPITTTYRLALSAAYEIDFWGKNRAALASAEAGRMASIYDRETVALTVTSNVATTYFQILQFRDRLDVARENLSNAERVLGVVEARVRNGAASPLDLAQQRAAVASQRATIPQLEVQARQSENALAILLGVTPEDLVVGDATLAALAPPFAAPGLPSELLLRRPDVQAAEAQLLAANADIGAARAALFPSIQLTGQYGFQSLALSTLFNPAANFFSLAGSLTQSIFQGGALVGEVDLARAQYEELVHNYRKAVLAAFADVENALFATRYTGEQEALQIDAVEQARLAYQLAETRYREGAVDLLVVLDAQRTLFQAEDQFVQVRFARLQAALSLFKALGGGWRV